MHRHEPQDSGPQETASLSSAQSNTVPPETSRPSAGFQDRPPSVQDGPAPGLSQTGQAVPAPPGSIQLAPARLHPDRPTMAQPIAAQSSLLAPDGAGQRLTSPHPGPAWPRSQMSPPRQAAYAYPGGLYSPPPYPAPPYPPVMPPHPLNPQQTHQKKLRREVTVLCVIFMLFSVISGVFSGMLLALSSSLGITGQMTGNLAAALPVEVNRLFLLVYCGLYFLMFAVPVCVFFLVRYKEKTTDYFYVKRKFNIGVTLLGCFGILAVNYAVTIFSEATDMFFQRIGVLDAMSDAMSLFSIGDDAVSNILVLFMLVILPAFLEEFCFRGVICGRIAQYNRTVAVLASAVLFSLMHMTIQQIPFAFLAGLLIGYVYIRTKSIWGCVLMHAVNNGLAYAQMYIFEKSADPVMAEKVFMMAFAGVFVIGLICLAGLFISHQEDSSPQRLARKPAASAVFGGGMFVTVCVLAVVATVFNAIWM